MIRAAAGGGWWSAARGVAGGAVARLGDLVLPPLCVSCAAPVAQHGALCTACWNGMDFIVEPLCQRLGTPFDADLGMDLISPPAIANPPVFARARGVARFDGTARHLVHRLKYSDRLDLVAAMARMMAGAGRDLLAEADILVPVPLHRFRLIRRRFNQANELARAIAGVSGRPVAAEVLMRRKATPSQVGLSALQRQRNLAGAFHVPEAMKPRISDRRVLIVDDVMTTGSTLNACARALKGAGAAEVDALVFAIVAERV